MHRYSIIAGLLMAGAAIPGMARADLIGSSFSQYYAISDIAEPAGLVGGYYRGGAVFDASDPNVLLFGMFAEYGAGRVLSVDVTRDPVTNNITGFTGSTSTVSLAPDIDGGLTYGPDGYLFFTQYSDNTIGEIQPGGTSPAFDESLPGVIASTGGLQFIPAGFGGAGNAAITSYNGHSICSAPVTLQTDGSYAFGTCTDTVTFPSAVEGIQYVPAGTPGFSSNSILVNLYSQGSVVAYEVDANGMPILSTATTFVTGFAYPEGITIDPVSGDVLVTSAIAGSWLVVSPDAPEPGTRWMVFGGLFLAAFSGTFRRFQIEE